jgi:transcriptional regulator of acetoin/glycerol metabolism
VIERAVVLGSSENIVPDDLPDTLLESGAGSDSPTNFHELVNEAKRNIVVSALQKAQGNYSEAARQLGIHPNNLHRLIRNLEVKWTGA